MGKMENPSAWEKIQKNVRETERLMGQKKYNLSMIKARQTLEYMIKLQCDKAGIVESTPETMIRELYSGKWISKSAAEHYLQIYKIGSRAANDGDDSAYNANEAYHILSQEIYSFTGNDKPRRPRRAPAQGSAQSKSRKKKEKSGLSSADLLKLLVPVVLVVVLIFLIRVLTPKKTPTTETSAAPTTVEQTAPTTTEAPATDASAPAVSYKTTTTLNVRKGPSTDDDRIGKLDPGAPVEFVRDHDDTWAVILYNGQEAYVSKEYLTEAE